MDKRRLNREEKFMDTIRETYLMFIEYIENPQRAGLDGIYSKLKPQAKELVKAKMLDSWHKTDRDLHRVLHRMRRIMGWYKKDWED